MGQHPVPVTRDLLQVRTTTQPLALDEVGPLETTFKHFDAAGVSLDTLLPEIRETLTKTMSILDGRPNSDEGGEDPACYGTLKSSEIKQMATGCFGVTLEYLVNAEALQIKVAQDAKPDEGGQLPGDRVDGLIARLCYAASSVILISSPSHHDIYSVENPA